jgi:hypothetical protein
MSVWDWKDPVAEPPPLRTRIRIRLSDQFRAAHRIKASCVDGYLIEPDTQPMFGFSTTFGPHVTGWMPVRIWSTKPIAVEASTDELSESLCRIGESIKARSATAPKRHWQD